MKMKDYVTIKEASLKLAILSSLGADEKTVSTVNEAFESADEEARRLLRDEFGQEELETAMALLDLSISEFPLARF
jgi:hypothetical protein